MCVGVITPPRIYCVTALILSMSISIILFALLAHQEITLVATTVAHTQHLSEWQTCPFIKNQNSDCSFFSQKKQPKLTDSVNCKTITTLAESQNVTIPSILARN